MEVLLLPRHTYMEPQKDFDAYIYMVKWALPLQFIGSSMIPIIASTVPFYVGTTCNFCTYAPAKQLNLLSFCTFFLFPKEPLWFPYYCKGYVDLPSRRQNFN